jgi:hypothetical protein
MHRFGRCAWHSTPFLLDEIFKESRTTRFSVFIWRMFGTLDNTKMLTSQTQARVIHGRVVNPANHRDVGKIQVCITFSPQLMLAHGETLAQDAMDPEFNTSVVITANEFEMFNVSPPEKMKNKVNIALLEKCFHRGFSRSHQTGALAGLLSN